MYALGLAILVVSERQHQLVEQLYARKSINRVTTSRRNANMTYFGILGPPEPGLVWSLRKTEPRQARRDNMETRMILSARRQKWKQLPDLKEVPRPCKPK